MSPADGQAASAAAIPLGQSSAAQIISGRTVPWASETDESGVHGAAHIGRPGQRPGKDPQPVARSAVRSRRRSSRETMDR